MKGERPLVSVIIPAFNAETTIGETLLSVQLQTLRDIEIFVIDDGSTDATLEIVAAAASEDPRIHLLSQTNGGVARARNAGIARARAELIAPIDADDLWRPGKLEYQLARIQNIESCSLVYTWYAEIDPASRILRFRAPDGEGDALVRFFQGNFIGHASSAMMRTRDVKNAGGYDESLLAQGAQGCEDLALYMSLAEVGDVAVVPRFLTGYRISPQNMSSNWLPMLRSFEILHSRYRPSYPKMRTAFRIGKLNFFHYLLNRALRERSWRRAQDIWIEAARQDPFLAIALLASWPVARAILPERVRETLKDLLGRSLWEGRSFSELP